MSAAAACYPELAEHLHAVPCREHAVASMVSCPSCPAAPLACAVGLSALVAPVVVSSTRQSSSSTQPLSAATVSAHLLRVALVAGSTYHLCWCPHHTIHWHLPLCGPTQQPSHAATSKHPCCEWCLWFDCCLYGQGGSTLGIWQATQCFHRRSAYIAHVDPLVCIASQQASLCMPAQKLLSALERCCVRHCGCGMIHASVGSRNLLHLLPLVLSASG